MHPECTLSARQETRFWSRVDRRGPDECWPWLGWRDRDGYGRFWHGSQWSPAHRIAWILTYGPAPDGLHGLHRCDNPSCCNPAHGWPDTNAANVADRVAKGRDGDHRGEANGRAVLSAADVRAIRARYAAGDVSKAALGREYGVSPTQILAIVTGRAWAHLR